MAGFRRDGNEDGRSVVVLDRDVPASGWHEIDLAQTFRLRGRAGAGSGAATLTAAASASILAFRAPAVCLIGTIAREITKRVPDDAFVSVGQSAGAVVPRIPARSSSSRVANDNVAGGNARSVWRDLFFLAVLAATVVGAFWSGRVHGVQRVIVVPGPSSFHSVIT
jgi:hypothetical protein